jgi:photosystem II stability/assembly factor-like uncharacterized protein
MKNVIQKIYLIILLAIIAISAAFSQDNKSTWRVMPIRSIEEYQSGAFGGEGEQHPHSIARSMNHPEFIYLSHDVGGSWRSTDNGDTWNKNLDKGLFLQFGQSIEVDANDPNIVFIIVDSTYNYKSNGYEGIYRSEDGGNSWTHVFYARVKSERFYRHNLAYFLSPLDDKPAKIWYAAFIDNGLYRSEDGGKTWSEKPVSSLVGHTMIYEVRTHPTNPDIVYVASNLGLFVSNQKGAGLVKIDALPEDVSSVAINPRNSDSIYATVYKKGIYLSNDKGTTFKQLLDHKSIRLSMNPGFPEQIYLTGDNRNSKFSNDGGANWEDIPQVTTFPGLGREKGWRRWIDGNISGIVPNPKDKNEAVAYSRSTIFKTTDQGNSFHESATGWTGNAWSWTDNSMAFDRHDEDKFAFFCNDIGTRITTTGGDWFHENTNSQAGQWYPSKILWYGTYSGDFYPEAGSQIMVASIGGYFKTQIMRTENLGQKWELVTEGASDQAMHLFISFNPDDPNIVYAGNKISTDAGKTFYSVTFPEQYDSPYIIGMCNAYPDIVYALNKACTVILRSCDQGKTWTEYAKPGWSFRNFDPLPTFAVDPINPKKVYTIDQNHDLASFDGVTWKSFNVMSNLEESISYDYVRNVAIDPNDPSIIYAGMFASGGSTVLRSTDSGDSWEDISNNLARIGGALKVNPHTGELYHGTLFGTWIYPAPYDEVPEPNQRLFSGINIIPSQDTLKVGDSKMLNIEDLTACLVDPEIIWSSDNESIAEVDQQGIIKAMNKGECFIIARTEDGLYTDSCSILVVDPTGIEDISNSPIKVSLIKNNLEIVSSDMRLQRVAIYNILGTKLLDYTYINSDLRAKESIDISQLKSGCYLIYLYTSDAIFSEKFIIVN